MKQVKEFIEKLKGDEALEAEVKKLRENKAEISDFIVLAADNGFHFTENDWLDFVKAGLSVGKEELDEAALDAVSGGGLDFMGCRFYKDKYPHGEYTLHGDIKIYARSCLYWMNPGMCNGLICGCHGRHCCMNGYHYTDEFGNAVHEYVIVKPGIKTE